MRELRSSHRTIHAAILPFWSRCRKSWLSQLGIICFAVASSLPCQELDHALPGPIEPDGNDNTDVAISHIQSADNRAPLPFRLMALKLGRR